MDNALVFGTSDGGSIPSEGTSKNNGIKNIIGSSIEIEVGLGIEWARTNASETKRERR